MLPELSNGRPMLFDADTMHQLHNRGVEKGKAFPKRRSDRNALGAHGPSGMNRCADRPFHRTE